jgi:putative hydrolase of the HAD superfamily
VSIKALVFDCFGVLVVSGHSSLKHDFPQHAQAITDLVLRSDYGYLSRDEFNTAASELVGLSVEAFSDTYWRANTRNESALVWIRELQATGLYKIGLLSNIGRNWLDDFLPAVEREHLFDAEVLSSEVGMTKPVREIYELVADRLGVEPYECIMIDDLMDNVDGAKHAGMDAVLFDNVTDAKIDVARIIEAV